MDDDMSDGGIGDALKQLAECKQFVVMSFLEYEGFGIDDSFDTVGEARKYRTKRARKCEGPVILVDLLERGKLPKVSAGVAQ
jgi:hypothetical protein